MNPSLAGASRSALGTHARHYTDSIIAVQSAAFPVPPLFARTPALRSPHRIVIPPPPSSSLSSAAASAAFPGETGDDGAARGRTHHPRSFRQGNTYRGGIEYDDDDAVAASEIPAAVPPLLTPAGRQTLARQQQVRALAAAGDAQAEELWRARQSHLRRQQRQVAELGVEGAVRERLRPSTVSFRAALRERPLDRHILEEIYYGLHGRRTERALKKGVAWEHWIAKGDGTAPVFTTSKKAQQTFAFGGKLTLLASTTDPRAFPTLLSAAGRRRLATEGADAQRAARHSRGGASDSHPSNSNSSSNNSNSNGNGNSSNAKHHKGRHRASKKPRTPGDARGAAAVAPGLLVPEIAFIGRTGSGKSSLVNALLNTAVSPYGHVQGTTAALRFYSVAERLVMVDCPGYGYYSPAATGPADAEAAVAALRSYLFLCRDPSKFPSGRRAAAASGDGGGGGVSRRRRNPGRDGGGSDSDSRPAGGGRGGQSGGDETEEAEAFRLYYEQRLRDAERDGSAQLPGGSLARHLARSPELGGLSFRGGESGEGESEKVSNSNSDSLRTATPGDTRADTHHRRRLPHQQPRPIKRVFVCVPARGVQHSDWDHIRLLERLGVPFSVVLTKTDAAPVRFLARLVDHTRAELSTYRHCQELLLTSALRLAGIDRMQTLIANVALDDSDARGAAPSIDFTDIV